MSFPTQEAYEAGDKVITERGLQALPRLVTVAQRDTGQSGVCRRFLLGLFNGPHFPFELTELRGLDLNLLSDAMAVLLMDTYRTEVEIHERIPKFMPLFRKWAEEEYARRELRSNGLE